MSFLFAFISTFFSALSKIFLKKSLTNNVNLFVGDYVSLILPFFLLVFGVFYRFFGVSQDFFGYDIFVYLITAISFVLYAVSAYISAKIYKIEKISYLIPYENLGSIVTIIGGFFLFHDVSNITFFIAIITLTVIILSSFNLKDLKFSFPILLFSFSKCISGIANIVSAYVLISQEMGGFGVDGLTFLILYISIGFLGYSVIALFFSWGKFIQKLGISNIYYRSGSGVFGYGSWLLSLMIISQIGLTLSILLGFLGMGFTLVLSYLFFQDIPSKKNIFLTVIIFILVTIGFYFK